MTLPGFTPEDFDVFTIPGLEPRMSALIERVRPKLTLIGEETAPLLSALCGEPMYPHVAKHARRTINPPHDTWVAWSNNKRGYKAYPHFQVGMWSTHLFIQFAIIYECPNKNVFAKHVKEQLRDVMEAVPSHFFWSTDHMKPDVTPHSGMNEAALAAAADRLERVKQAEILCGLSLAPSDPTVKDGDKLLEVIGSTFETLMPLYRISF
jgi:uncharacterized protein YktB (UPF0637 family)